MVIAIDRKGISCHLVVESDWMPPRKKILDSVRCSVYVFNGDGTDASMGIRKDLEALGATCTNSFAFGDTHLIWNNGPPELLSAAHALNVKPVSYLWVVQCREAGRMVDESDFSLTPENQSLTFNSTSKNSEVALMEPVAGQVAGTRDPDSPFFHSSQREELPPNEKRRNKRKEVLKDNNKQSLRRRTQAQDQEQGRDKENKRLKRGEDVIIEEDKVWASHSDLICSHIHDSTERRRVDNPISKEGLETETDDDVEVMNTLADNGDTKRPKRPIKAYSDSRKRTSSAKGYGDTQKIPMPAFKEISSTLDHPEQYGKGSRLGRKKKHTSPLGARRSERISDNASDSQPESCEVFRFLISIQPFSYYLGLQKQCVIVSNFDAFNTQRLKFIEAVGWHWYHR